MRLLIVILIVLSTSYAKEYYAKAEPYEILNVTSNVSAEVLYTDSASQGKVLGKKSYIVMDDKLDKVELQSVESKINALQKTLEHNRQMGENYQQIIEMKQANFDRIKELKIKSAVEKDREYFDLINSRNSLLSIQKEIESLNISLGDLKLRRSQLQKSIVDKHLSAPGYVLYQLSIKPSAFVNPGTPLAQIADVRKAKLTVYLSASEVSEVQHKKIYLNGVKSPYKIDRLWKIADASKLSSYRAEILIVPPAQFSQLIKVEFK
ncbi:HlyD family secretion protein [Sulfuricurvum sp.]|uniref:HlyD family secretion protein n=1 Tax=Sulfuricurvum sp. TaxID=2025608 RepID=UPI0026198397|nr:HlyD family secretion protein [Sulfuricurvum sp.]MDD2779919.1 HlyD family secretion protein [Sulfuricurvum sp.]